MSYVICLLILAMPTDFSLNGMVFTIKKNLLRDEVRCNLGDFNLLIILVKRMLCMGHPYVCWDGKVSDFQWFHQSNGFY